MAIILIVLPESPDGLQSAKIKTGNKRINNNFFIFPPLSRTNVSMFSLAKYVKLILHISNNNSKKYLLLFTSEKRLSCFLFFLKSFEPFFCRGQKELLKSYSARTYNQKF